MSIKYEFYKRSHLFDDGVDINANWSGKYTIGYVGCKGTRLWLRPPNAFTFATQQMDSWNELNQELQKADLNTDLSDELNLRAEFLQMILQEMIEEVKCPHCCKFYTGYSKEILDKCFGEVLSWEIQEEINEFLLDKKDSFHVLVSESIIWLILDKEAIITELKEVLSECNKQNVTWQWI